MVAKYLWRILMNLLPLILIIGISVWAYHNLRENVSPAAIAPTPTVITSAPVLEAVRQVNKQIFIEHYNAVDVTYTEAPAGWIGLLGIKQEFVVLLRGTVPAGFDLQNLSEADIWVSEDGKRVQLTLPPPRIFADNVSLDLENSRVIAQTDRCPNVICQDTLTAYQNTALPEGQQLLIDFALENGILDQVARDGREYYQQLLKSLGFDEVRVVIRGYDEGQ